MKKDKNKYNTYHFKAKGNRDDLFFTILDLIPIYHQTEYTYRERVRFLNYSEYEPDWNQEMNEEYKVLYALHGNPKIDFFRIKGTQVIVLPGTFIYPTILKRKEIT